MCTPFIGTMISAVGTYQQGAAAASQATYAEKVANQNAVLANEQANDVQRQKAEEQSIIREQAKQTRGRQMAAMAGAGIDSGTGTGLDILTDSAYTTQQDINQSDMNAARKQWAYKQQSENYRAEAGAYGASAKSARLSGLIGAAGQFASMGAVSDKWTKGSASSGGPGGVKGNLFNTDFASQYGANSYRNGFSNSMIPKAKRWF